MERTRLSADPLVLIVDDQSSNLVMLQQMVRWAGYRTHEAQSGQQALEMIERYQPDVVVVDIFMPDMDGFEVLRGIRQQANASYTPVIMITAQEEARARQQAYLEGADDFLLKPIDSETLRARLRVAVHLKRTLSRVEMERERFAFIASLSRDLGQINSLSEMLDHIIDVCGQALNASHANLLVLGKSGLEIDVVASSLKLRGNTDDLDLVIDRGAAGYVLQTGQSICIDNIRTDPRWLYIETSIIQCGSALLVPLGDTEGMLGVLEVYHDETSYFTLDDQELMELVARQITGLLRQTRLRDEQSRLTDQLSLQARQLRLVNSLAHTLTSNLDLPMLYRAINAQMNLLLGDVATGWYEFHPDGNVRLAYASLFHEIPTTPIAEEQIAQIGPLSTLERTVRFRLADIPSMEVIDVLLTRGYDGCIAVPLHHQGRMLGVLMVTVLARQFTVDEESLLDMARPHLAVALSTAQAIADREARQRELAELVHLRNMAELAGQMAHHFNNLFTAILGNTQLAELDAVSDEQRLLLSTVVDQVRDGANMIKRLYLLKGAERIPPLDSIEMSEALPMVLDHLEQTIGIAPITNLDIAPNLRVPIQERELMTLCGELIANALEGGSPPDAVTVRAYSTPQHVVLEIADRGDGIAPEDLNSVWRPFWTKHGPQRLGLGLPICSAVMWRLGGRIHLESNTPNPGITVMLLFPHAEDHPA